MNVSILILTFNEEKNLPTCLAALRWCDDIVVLDSGSVDQTVTIAEEFGARVLVRPFDNFASQRNFGLLHGDFKYDWILHLDADEVLTDAFISCLQALEPTDGIDGYRVPSKMMLMERWLHYSGMYPAYQVRIGHFQRLRFKQVGHGQREDVPDNRIATFSEPYLHYCFSGGLQNWFAKHVRYAADEALEVVRSRAESSMRSTTSDLFSRNTTVRRRAYKTLAHRLPLWGRPFARFVYVLVIRRGFFDGVPGLLYAFMLSIYEGMIAVLAYEILHHQKHSR